jgi:hypothetical protein
VYTDYGFQVFSNQRMMDEQWQAQVEGGKNLPLPDWTKLFIPP